MLRWGIMPSTAGEKVQGTVREPRCFEVLGPGVGGEQPKQMGVNTSLWVRQHKRAKEEIREEDSDCWVDEPPPPPHRLLCPPSTVPPDAPHADADDGLGMKQRLALWLHQF